MKYVEIKFEDGPPFNAEDVEHVKLHGAGRLVEVVKESTSYTFPTKRVRKITTVDMED